MSSYAINDVARAVLLLYQFCKVTIRATREFCRLRDRDRGVTPSQSHARVNPPRARCSLAGSRRSPVSRATVSVRKTAHDFRPWSTSCVCVCVRWIVIIRNYESITRARDRPCSRHSAKINARVSAGSVVVATYRRRRRRRLVKTAGENARGTPRVPGPCNACG